MEKLAQYRTVLSHLLEHEAHYRPRNGDIEVVTLCDTIHDQYQLLYIGWDGQQRVFAPIIHVRIHNEKIWIEHDGTEEGIANILLRKGVPRDDIVLAFHAPWKRPYTDFAIA